MAQYATGPVGYKKFCDERIDFLDMLRKEKLERKKLLGLLRQDEIDALTNKNRSIDKQVELDEILKRMKNQTSSLQAIRDQVKEQELEDKKKEMLDNVRKKLREELHKKKIQELEINQK